MMDLSSRPVCPISRGRETRMLQSTFEKMCAAKQEEKIKTYNHESLANMYCQECKGTVPKEVTFMEVSQMATEKKVCEQCGEPKGVSSHYGKLVCSVCVMVRGACKNRPKSVVDGLREFNGSLVSFLSADEIRQIGMEYGGSSPDQQEQGEVEAIIQERDELKKTVFALQSAKDELHSRANNDTQTIIDLQRWQETASEKIVHLEEKLVTAELVAEDLKKMAAPVQALELEPITGGINREHLLTLVLDISRGIVEKRMTLPRDIYRRLHRLVA